MRTKRFPWGMPWVHGGISSRLNDENTLIHLTFKCMQTFLEIGGEPTAPRWLALVSPEDLGSIGDDSPASLWQLNELHDLAESFRLHRSAFCQCRMGPSAQARPTGLLTSHPPLTGSCKSGWPKITGEYLGPLPKICGCGRRHTSMQRGKKKFNTPQRMLERDTTRLLAATLKFHCSTSSTAGQGLPRMGDELKLLEALIPHAKLYGLDEDGYDTDATVLLEPPEKDRASYQTPEHAASRQQETWTK